MTEWEPSLAALSVKVGPYKLDEPLGQGGMGAVWRAWDERLKRQVALKRLRSDRGVPGLRERLLREARAIARLQHPAIVQVYDIVEEGGEAWIVMELVEGVTLRRWIEANGALDPSHAVRFGQEVAEGLAEAHAQGVLHRDLKATNVMVTPSGRAKILDFGIAKQLPRGGTAGDQEETISSPGRLLGTVYAMSPEQAEGQALDERSDLFSFGSLLYEAVAGRPPFLGGNLRESLEQVLSFRPPPLAQVRKGVPGELSDLVARLLEKDRRLRPGSAREVAGALAALGRTGTFRDQADGEARLGSTVLAVPRSFPRQGGAPGRLPREARRRTLGEHRPVSLVCCGLASSDEASGGTANLRDLEAMSEAMDDFQALTQEVCRRFGGQPGGVLGHLVWFSFGYPRAHEDDAQRAVQAARELCSRFAGAVSGARRRLAPRVAVHTGPALVVLRGGQPERLQPGPTLDLAMALQGAAPVGEVVVSAACRLLTGRSFATEALAPVPVPGSPEPLVSFRVLGPVHPRERQESRHAAMLGRERELALLCDRFQLARSGTGQVVMISGEPGIGKSRLIRALRERLASEPAVWRFAYGSLTTESAPLAPILDLLERAVFEPDGGGGERSLRQLESFLSRHGLPLAENVPLLAPLLSLPLEGRYPSLALSPNVQRKKTFESLVVLFAEMAERGPLVLVVEDLHWIDPSTLDFLSRLIEEVVALPLLLVATFRPELQPPWGHRAVLTQLHLSRLTDEETAQLVDRLTAGRELTEGLRQRILTRAEGVPLFAEELARTFLDAGQAGDVGEIPVTLGGSLAARLDRVGGAKEVAQVASVIGRTFSRELLEAVAPIGPEALEDGLDELVRAELVYRRGLGSKARLTFRHALIQEAAYASLLSRDRHRLHLEIAQALERQLARPGQPEADGHAAGPLELAHHWSKALEAGEPEPELVRQALPHLLAAGEHASRLGAYRETQARLGFALSLIPALPAGPDRDEQELTLLVRLTQAVKATKGGAAPEVQALRERMRALWRGSENHPDLFVVLFEIWSKHMFRCELEEALAVAMEGLDRFHDPRSRFMAARCASHSLYFLAWLPESLYFSEMALAAPLLDGEAEFSNHGLTARLFAAHQSALSLLFLGMEKEALSRHDLAMALTNQLQDPLLRVNSLAESLKFLRRRRDILAALQTADELQCLLVELDLPAFVISASHTRNWALTESGRAADAVEATQANLHLHEEYFAGVGTAASCAATGLIFVRAGRLEQAEEILERGLAVAHEGACFQEAELHCIQGELYLERANRDGEAADLDKAEAELRRAFMLASQRLQIPVAQEAVSLLLPLLESERRFEEAEKLEIAMQRLREEAAAQAGKVLDEAATWPDP